MTLHKGNVAFSPGVLRHRSHGTPAGRIGRLDEYSASRPPPVHVTDTRPLRLLRLLLGPTGAMVTKDCSMGPRVEGLCGFHAARQYVTAFRASPGKESEGVEGHYPTNQIGKPRVVRCAIALTIRFKSSHNTP
jgi:hypothetical protein